MRIFPILVLLLLAGCAGKSDNFDFDTCGVRPRAVLAVNLVRGVPLVQASINGGPATLILDTGAEVVTLTAPAVRRLNLESNPHRLISTFGAGGESQFFPAQLRNFQLAGLAIPDHEVPVIPKPLPDVGAGVPDGLLGVTILSNFEMDLDMPRHRLTLYAGRLCPETVVPVWRGAYGTIDAGKSTRGRFVVTVQVNGHPMNALIDTGTQITLMAADSAASAGVTGEMLTQDRNVSMTGSGPEQVQARLHRFAELQIDDEVFHNVPLLVGPRQLGDVDLILGMDYLAGHRLWLSYARRRVFVAHGSVATATR
jgi:clan AA aspartic protease (TIGR02281 family)